MMLKAALAQTALECGTLLGQQLEIGDGVVREVTRDAYFKGMENASFVVGIDSQGDYPGSIYIIISVRDAIVLSGTLLGVPPARIIEKKKLAILEADDVDAFSEIANQMTGSFNSVFKPSLPKTVHLKQLAPRQFIPDKDIINAEEPAVDGDYFLLQSQLTLAGAKMEQIELLIPLPLAKLFDLQESSKDALPEPDIEAAPGGPLTDELSVSSVLILEDNDTERQHVQDILAAAGVSQMSAALNADLTELLSKDGLKAVLLGVTNANEQELSVCLKIQTILKGISIPIIMCGREWTRTAVLKALKYGAGDIMLKPCAKDELTSKVLKLVNAL